MITEFVWENFDIIGRYDIPIIYQLLSLIFVLLPLTTLGMVLDIVLMPIELIYIKWVNKE